MLNTGASLGAATHRRPRARHQPTNQATRQQQRRGSNIDASSVGLGCVPPPLLTQGARSPPPVPATWCYRHVCACFFLFLFPLCCPLRRCRAFSQALSTTSSDDVSYNPASCHVRGESALVLSRVISRATACFVRAESDTPLTIILC